MKKIILLAVLSCFWAFSFGQHISYADLQSGKNAQELTGRLSGAVVESYTASDGVTYTAGSEIIYGTPFNGGQFYNNFYDQTSGVLNALAGSTGNTRVANRYGGKATIKKIECVPIDAFNRKTSGCKIYLVLNNGGVTLTNFESAIEQGEVLTTGYTSDSALQELKKAKEKFDLGLITEEEYEAKKTELSKYIK